MTHTHTAACRCGGVKTVTAEEWQKLIDDIELQKKERAEKLPDENACLRQMIEAYYRLKELGWNDAIYCPKDSSLFDAIEFGSTGIHTCNYSGEWPKGTWWVHDACDLFPSRPVLFRAKAEGAA